MKQVVIAGLSNVYTHYITTFEEYQAQRYEAASTIYGPHTLEIYLQKYKDLINPLLNGGNKPYLYFFTIVVILKKEFI